MSEGPPGAGGSEAGRGVGVTEVGESGLARRGVEAAGTLPTLMLNAFSTYSMTRSRAGPGRSSIARSTSPIAATSALKPLSTSFISPSSSCQTLGQLVVDARLPRDSASLRCPQLPSHTSSMAVGSSPSTGRRRSTCETAVKERAATRSWSLAPPLTHYFEQMADSDCLAPTPRVSPFVSRIGRHKPFSGGRIRETEHWTSARFRHGTAPTGRFRSLL